jgi:uncharacterized protein HemX
MAKWLAVLLALLVVVAGLFYVWQHQPLQEALEAAQRQAADQGREIAALRARVNELEVIRDQLQRANSELKEQVGAKDTEQKPAETR